MEGAAWIIKKAFSESELLCDRVISLVKEFSARAKAAKLDDSLVDFDGRRVNENNQWIC